VAGPDGTKKLTLKPWGRITRRQEDNSRVRFLSQEEEAAIAKELRERYPNYLNVFILALHTGARTSEVLRGQVGDYNSQTGMIKIHQTKDSRKPKVRFVPMTPMAVAAYKALAAGQRERGPPLHQPQWSAALRNEVLVSPCARSIWREGLHLSRRSAHGSKSVGNVWRSARPPSPNTSAILVPRMVMRYAHLQPEVNAKAINAAMSFYPAKPRFQADTKTNSDTKSDTSGSRARKRCMNIDDL
jgi:hypothetical protein